MQELVEKALTGDKWSIGRLISVFEDRRPAAADQRGEILRLLAEHPDSRRGRFIGMTGTPGAGKSTLIGELANRLIQKGSAGAEDSKAAGPGENFSVAVLAIDPSSEVSGGSILGDRTRVNFALDEKRLFFRSQASDRELGGVSRSTFQVARLLFFLFDFVLIETVGIGQNEIEIQYVADRIYLVLQPLGGDGIQFMKAGIMEIPDVFVLNKADAADAAKQSYYALKAALSFVRPGEEDLVSIIKTSAISGLGLDDLSENMAASRTIQPRRSMSEKEIFYFEKWVRDEYGRVGLRRLVKEHGGARAYIERHNGSFDRAQAALLSEYQNSGPVAR
ncbi:MAG: protein kinase [bacterium]|nr:protein kinase [bacterium]